MILDREGEKYQKKKNEVYDQLTGHVTIYNEVIVIPEVQRKTGIKPPAWFKTEVTLSDAQLQVSRAARR